MAFIILVMVFIIIPLSITILSSCGKMKAQCITAVLLNCSSVTNGNYIFLNFVFGNRK